jgi:hypothetical protein
VWPDRVRVRCRYENVKVFARVHLADVCGERTYFLRLRIEPEFVVALWVSCKDGIIYEGCNAKWCTWCASIY